MTRATEFWKDKHVLVTGAKGFFGSNIIKELTQKGAHVYALVSNTKPGNSIFQNTKSHLSGLIVGDVRDYDGLADIFRDHHIGICFHLAAQPIVGAAFESPLSTFDVNIRGTINVLEAARSTSTLEGLVIASSTHVYGNNPNPPYVESFYPAPSRPYETSKACADMLAQTYYYTFGLPIAIARPTNTYGPGDLNFSRLIPKVMQSIVARENPEIVGGTSIRDYLYIKDALDGYLKLAENLHRPEIQGQAFNFGSGQILSATAIAEKAVEIAPSGLRLVIKPGVSQTKDISQQYVSTEKAKALLGWKPTHSLEDSLQETYQWYDAWRQAFRSSQIATM